MSNEPLRVGIVGAGWVAINRHIPAFRQDGRARIVAIADHSPGRAKDIAQKFRIPHHATDPEDLFRRVEIVSICTPPWTHADLTIRAFHHGCHVLVEKPMATARQQAISMIDAAAAKHRMLCVAHNFLFSRSGQRALQCIAHGDIGDPHTLYAYQLSSRRRRLPHWHARLPGGLFFDEAPHMLYLIRAILGELTVVDVRTRFGEDGGTSSIHALLQAERGEARLEILSGAPISEWGVIAVGTKGVLAVDLFRDIIVSLGTDHGHAPPDVLKTSMATVTQHLVGTLKSGLLLVGQRLSFGHTILVRRFIDAVVGGASLPVTAQDGLAIVDALERIVTLGQLQE